MNSPNRFKSSPLFGFDKKESHYYKGLRMKTDTNLHEQLSNFINNKLELIDIHGKKPCVLDWGCGEGAFSQRLYDLGYNVIAVDGDADNFKAQGPVFYKIDFNHSLEVESFINKHGGSFDLIVSIEVIEHIKNPWQFLKNLYQLCRQDTHLVITTPNISSWWGRFWFLITGELWGFNQNSWASIGHINPIGNVEMINMLCETGFICLDVWAGGNLPVIWLYNWKRTVISLLILPIYLIMKGQKQGWVLCYYARRKHCK
ncbi:class I SAM-dependent methyltransferase [Trichocoleus sp. Lan]|uniref:class I SAM-dependent methyltransferase n=1 Tax=Trichocoleus sp. Lan TaxID=2933927 RepID=UPI003298422B